jgi:hypothetical protein
VVPDGVAIEVASVQDEPFQEAAVGAEPPAAGT